MTAPEADCMCTAKLAGRLIDVRCPVHGVEHVTDVSEIQLPPLPIDVVRTMHDAMAGYFQFRHRVRNSPFDLFNNVDVDAPTYQRGLIALYNALMARAAATPEGRMIVMKEQHWAVSARYAAPGARPRHPSPEHFCQRTIVGPMGAATVEAVLDLLEVPEDVRVKIRAYDVVRHFVDGVLLPDQPYPHHKTGAHYVSREPDAQLVEWEIAFVFVTQILDQGTRDLA